MTDKMRKERIMNSDKVSKRGSDLPASGDLPVYTPSVDIRETSDGFIIEADMPGVAQEGVDIDLERNRLTLHGKIEVPIREGYTLSHGEFRKGNYERAFTLGNEIDRENVKAVLTNGVLRLELPKVKEMQPRRIAVAAG
jgi:HSP20 family molecular chaperone IbpA